MLMTCLMHWPALANSAITQPKQEDVEPISRDFFTTQKLANVKNLFTVDVIQTVIILRQLKTVDAYVWKIVLMMEMKQKQCTVMKVMLMMLMFQMIQSK